MKRTILLLLSLQAMLLSICTEVAAQSKASGSHAVESHIPIEVQTADMEHIKSFYAVLIDAETNMSVNFSFVIPKYCSKKFDDELRDETKLGFPSRDYYRYKDFFAPKDPKDNSIKSISNIKHLGNRWYSATVKGLKKSSTLYFDMVFDGYDRIKIHNATFQMPAKEALKEEVLLNMDDLYKDNRRTADERYDQGTDVREEDYQVQTITEPTSIMVPPPPPPAPEPESGVIVEENKVYDVVEQQPTFDGDLSQWLASNLKYPPVAAQNGIEGRVIVQFVVSKTGDVVSVVVVRGVDQALDKEAVRCVSSMPKWKPGKQNGKEVNCKFTLPIIFRLTDPVPVKPTGPSSPYYVSKYPRK